MPIRTDRPDRRGRTVNRTVPSFGVFLESSGTFFMVAQVLQRGGIGSIVARPGPRCVNRSFVRFIDSSGSKTTVVRQVPVGAGRASPAIKQSSFRRGPPLVARLATPLKVTLCAPCERGDDDAGATAAAACGRGALFMPNVVFRHWRLIPLPIRFLQPVRGRLGR